MNNKTFGPVCLENLAVLFTQVDPTYYHEDAKKLEKTLNSLFKNMFKGDLEGENGDRVVNVLVALCKFELPYILNTTVPAMFQAKKSPYSILAQATLVLALGVTLITQITLITLITLRASATGISHEYLYSFL